MNKAGLVGKKTPVNSPLRAVNQRRKNAVERMEHRLSLSNEELFKDAKSFKSARKSGDSITEEGFNSYRESLKKVLENTKKKIAN